jgi:lysophospholipase L1-like esterase
MARRHQGKVVERAGLGALLLSALVVSAFGQSAVPAAPSNGSASMPAPFSQDCQIGNEALVEQSPLPNVASALQNRKQIRILAIGASPPVNRRYAAGGQSERIRDILQQAVKGLDVVMINRGVSGELSAQAAERIKTQVALHEPDLVLWQVGTNDALAYVPLEELESTISETVSWLREHKVDVVLAGLQYVDRMAQDDHYKAVRELLRKIAAKNNVMIVRRYEAQRLLSQAEGSGGGLVPDEFQRTEAGYTCLSQYMARAIALGIFGQRLKIQPIANPPRN